MLIVSSNADFNSEHKTILTKSVLIQTYQMHLNKLICFTLDCSSKQIQICVQIKLQFNTKVLYSVSVDVPLGNNCW